ncbi:MAG: DUF1800 family protein [bacterium]
MSRIKSTEAAIAVNRFGLGATPGELDAAASNPRRWLLEQLEGDYQEPDEFRGFLSTAEHRRNYFYRYAVIGPELNTAQTAAKEADDQEKFEALGRDIGMLLGGYVTWVAHNFMLEYGARTNVALNTPAPFRERLVRFWSNHLVVPAIKQQTDVICGAYEREVIRPHAIGRFDNMLQASAKNPAMLVFLDNHVSVGANSIYGKKSKNGLNENLAREILELHTLGVEGGYTQEDVIELARAITGWTTYPAFSHLPYLQPQYRGQTPGAFEYQSEWHEPGPRTVLGKKYPPGGIEQGDAILNDLSRHPATARFLATKLARHFIADEPTPALVARLAAVYLAHDTDIGEMARALVDTPEVWAQAKSKVKQPEDFALSCYRALGLSLGEQPVQAMKTYNFATYKAIPNRWAWLANDTFNFLDGNKDPTQFKDDPLARDGAAIALFYADIQAMGQSPMNAPGPQGWYDRWTDWSGADSMLKRVEWALNLATQQSDKVSDARTLLANTLGDLANTDLTSAVARAATKEQGIGLTLASPDFQRR